MITGRAILDLKNYFHERCDKEDEIYSKCRLDETKMLKDKPVLASQWYDLEIYKDMLQAYNKVYPGKIEDAAEYLAKKQIKGFFGFVSKFFTFEKLMKNANSNFRRYYSDGEFRITNPEKNIVKVSISGIRFNDELRDLTMYYQKKVGEIATGKKARASLHLEESDRVEFRFTLDE